MKKHSETDFQMGLHGGKTYLAIRNSLGGPNISVNFQTPQNDLQISARTINKAKGGPSGSRPTREIPGLVRLFCDCVRKANSNPPLLLPPPVGILVCRFGRCVSLKG